MDPHGCPVCGYPAFNALDESGCTTFEICPACGCESGYNYGKDESVTRLTQLRRKWFIETNGAWWNPRVEPPVGWSASRQLEDAGLKL